MENEIDFKASFNKNAEEFDKLMVQILDRNEDLGSKLACYEELDRLVKEVSSNNDDLRESNEILKEENEALKSKLVLKFHNIGPDEELWKQARDQWGKEFNCMIGMEECCELAQAISKINRYHNNTTRKNLVEEIVDVQNVISFLSWYYEIKEEDLEGIRPVKMERLKVLLAYKQR
jgi:NTP pyrophosphatase (non-canonical NTP hydrolase)